MWCLVILSLALAGRASTLQFPGDAGTNEYKRAKVLIEQLGDRQFVKREAAAKALSEMNAAAATALWEGLAAADAEVQRRCKELLTDAVTADWKRRGDAFEVDAKGERFHRLPMYDRYVQLAGKDSSARKLFAAMLRANGELLAEAAGGKKSSQAYYDECDRLLRAPGGKTDSCELSGRLAVLFLLSSGLTDEKAKVTASKGASHLLAGKLVSDALQANGAGPAFRRLLVGWAKTRDLSDTGTVVHLLFGVQQHQLVDALPLVEKIGSDRSAPPWARALALEVLVDLMGKKSVAILEKLFREEAATTRGADQAEGRVGDHALGHAITIRGAQSKDFGLQRETAAISILGPQGASRTLNFYYFNSPAEREAALKRWEQEERKKD